MAQSSLPETIGSAVAGLHRVAPDLCFPKWRATAGEDLIYATARDITDQRLAEVALRESEARFRAVFEQATVGVAEADGETGRYVRINQRFCDILGYSQDELMITGLDRLTHPKDLPQDLAILKRIQQDGNCEPGREKRRLHKDGSTVWINMKVTALSELNACTRSNACALSDRRCPSSSRRATWGNKWNNLRVRSRKCPFWAARSVSAHSRPPWHHGQIVSWPRQAQHDEACLPHPIRFTSAQDRR